jgi:glycosyltransferase involved in cell wall biosynthesis
MKVLHVIASLATRYGGPSKACLEMARAAADLGHEVSIYTTNVDGPTELNVPTDSSVTEDGVEVRYFPIQLPRFWAFSIPLAKALRQTVKEYDIVHIHSLYLFHNAAAGHYCREYSVPYLIRPHGTLDPFLFERHRLRKIIMELLFERKNIKCAAAIHFTTEEEKRLAEPYTFGTPGIVVPHGLDLAEYQNLPASGAFKSQYPETNGKKIILFFGRINFKKGLDILARAYSMVARSRDDVHLVIAGPDNEGFGEKVRGWLSDEGVLERVTFTGMLKGLDKLVAMRDAEMFVLPSYSENFGIAVVEAMACGIPVIISDKVNIWREVEQGRAGKVTPCNVERFAEAMVDLIEAPKEAKLMGENGKVLVRDRFQWSKIAFALEAAYRSILSGEVSESLPMKGTHR